MIRLGKCFGTIHFRNIAIFPILRAAHTLSRKSTTTTVSIEIPSNASSVYRKPVVDIPWGPKKRSNSSKIEKLLKRGHDTHGFIIQYFRSKLNIETQRSQLCEAYCKNLVKIDVANSHKLTLKDKKSRKVIYETKNNSFHIYLGYLSRLKDVRHLHRFIAPLLDEKNPLAIELGLKTENGYTDARMRKKCLANFRLPKTSPDGPLGIGSKTKEVLGSIFEYSEKNHDQTVILSLASKEKLQFVFRPVEVPLVDIKGLTLQDLIMKGKSINVLTICRALLLQKYKLQPKRSGSTFKFRHTILSKFHRELRHRSLYFLKMNISSSIGDKTIEFQINDGVFFIYAALKDLKEKGSGIKTILEVLSRSQDKVLHFDRDRSNVEHGNEFDSEILREINYSLPPSKASLNKAILSDENRPTLFIQDGQCARLPALPKELGQSKFSLLTKHVLHANLNDSLEEDKEIAFLLDFIGDRILFYEFMEYSSKNQLPSHLSIINSNVVLSHLSQLYDLRRLVQSAQRSPGPELSPSQKREQDGDLFERVIALVYLANEKACSKWLFQIFEVFRLFYEAQLYTEKLQQIYEDNVEGSDQLILKVHSPSDTDFAQILMGQESYSKYISTKERSKLLKEFGTARKEEKLMEEYNVTIETNTSSEPNGKEVHNEATAQYSEANDTTVPEIDNPVLDRDHSKYNELNAFLKGIRKRVAEKKSPIE